MTYANVAATLALVLACSGTAVAAGHYLISSTTQISPTVLKALRGAGRRGATGATGAKGATGAGGPAGEIGERGERGERGPRGEAGEPGQPGEPGIGTSAGYATHDFGPMPIGSLPNTIASKVLPARHYILVGKALVSAQGESPGDINIKCTLEDEGTLIDYAGSYGPIEPVSITPKYLRTVSLPLDGGLTTTSTSTVEINCRTEENSSGDELLDAGGTQLEAISTATLH
jgi:Collagen triple helix repeat (20 copies)